MVGRNRKVHNALKRKTKSAEKFWVVMKTENREFEEKLMFSLTSSLKGIREVRNKPVRRSN